MALLVTKTPKDLLLELQAADEGLYPINHILEPEYHQDKYVEVCDRTSKMPDAFQIGAPGVLCKQPFRGLQPAYADDENDASSLRYEGMVTDSGDILSNQSEGVNICALKSACIRFGYIDYALARSVSRDFYNKRGSRAAVVKNDVLVNSTGDGTIGRVAIFDESFPAVVDGHITILRFNDPDLAWYVAAYLLSNEGQFQIYRYINGSSGQVEIYPQDIARLWIKPPRDAAASIRRNFSSACGKYRQFVRDLYAALKLPSD